MLKMIRLGASRRVADGDGVCPRDAGAKMGPAGPWGDRQMATTMDRGTARPMGILEAGRKQAGDSRSQRRDAPMPAFNPSTQAHATNPCVCECCGEPARVRILRGYQGGKPVRHAFCLACAERWADALAPTAYSGGLDARRVRLSTGAILVFGGILVAILGAAADLLGVGSHAGFGWAQQSGLVLGLVFVAIGALLRIDIVGVVGTLCVGLAALADFLGSSPSPGIGWRQQLAMGAGLLLIVAGVLMRRRSRAAAARHAAAV